MATPRTSVIIPRRRNVGISGIAVTAGALGAWFVYAAIRDVNPVTGLGTLLRGEVPESRSPGDPYTGPGAAAAKVGGDMAAIAAGQPVGIDATTVVGGIRVHTSIAGQVGQLLKDAKAAGITGVGGGGWRSTTTQAALRIKNGCTCSNSSSCCGTPTAPVGKSMHERGLAIDFTQNGSTINRNSSLFGWLVKNASRYGLQNLPSEPWHWSTNGK